LLFCRFLSSFGASSGCIAVLVLLTVRCEIERLLELLYGGLSGSALEIFESLDTVYFTFSGVWVLLLLLGCYFPIWPLESLEQPGFSFEYQIMSLIGGMRQFAQQYFLPDYRYLKLSSKQKGRVFVTPIWQLTMLLSYNLL